MGIKITVAGVVLLIVLTMICFMYVYHKVKSRSEGIAKDILDDDTLYPLAPKDCVEEKPVVKTVPTVTEEVKPKTKTKSTRTKKSKLNG